MTAAVVAFALQAAWIVVRVALERAGFMSSAHSYMVTFGLALASSIAIAASALDLARRSNKRRRAAAITIACALSIGGASAVVEVLVRFRVIAGTAAWSWVRAMTEYGWTVLDVLAIAGFTVAAGRRAAWLAPVAIAGALLGALPIPTKATLSVLAIVKLGVLVLVADQAGRLAQARDPSREQARRGLARAELAAWIGAAVTFMWGVLAIAPLPLAVALGLVCVALVDDAVLACAAWSIARAELSELPRSLWYVAAIGTGTSAVRYALSWLLAIVHRWGHFDQLSLGPTPWSLAIPSLVATVASFAAIAYFARRTQSRSLASTAFAGIAASLLAFVLHIALNGVATTVADAGSVAATLVAVRALRRTQRALREPIANVFA